MNKRNCASEDAQALFVSPYLDAFDVASFRDEHGDVPKDVLNAAKEDHSQKYYVMTGAAKQLCFSCPALNECLQFVKTLDKADDVYGVVAGMTVPERKEFLKQEKNHVIPGTAAAKLMGA